MDISQFLTEVAIIPKNVSYLIVLIWRKLLPDPSEPGALHAFLWVSCGLTTNGDVDPFLQILHHWMIIGSLSSRTSETLV